MNIYEYELTDNDRKVASLKDEYYRRTEGELLNRFRQQYDSLYKGKGLQNHPKIFVYTPTYNRGEILMERAFNSVLKQTYDNWEYLIVGDSCTDDTEKFVSSCCDKRVKFINIADRSWRYPPTAENHWLVGPVVAANLALRMANGDWIARIDDDDVWVDDHLESVLGVAGEGNWEFVSGATEELREGKVVINRGDRLYGDYYGIPFPDGDDSVYNPYIGGISTTLYRSYLRHFEFNPDCWRKSHNRVNDLDLLSRFGLMGVRMGYVDRVELKMYPRPGENDIGSKAYRSNPSKMEEHFKF